MKKITTRTLLASLAVLLCASAAQAQIISTVAGTGVPFWSGDGAAATSAEINEPRGVAFDVLGNMYIADAQNNRIRKVDAAGNISTYAGTGTAGFTGNGGPATAAELNHPYALAFDHAGNLYVADYVNNVIRKITPAGIIVAFAGTGAVGTAGDGGPATAAPLTDPSGIAVDPSGSVYITSPASSTVRKINAAGIITTVAGTGTLGFSGDGGAATAAMLNTPHSVAFDTAGNMYIADQYNGRIRKVTTIGTISTIAGTGVAGSGGDGGPATAADILNPTGVAVDAAGNVYVASYNGQVIRMINATGTIYNFAGVTYAAGYNGDGGTADTSKLNHPYCVAVGNDGNIYIADQLNSRIRKVRTIPCPTADAGMVLSTNGNAFCNGDSTLLYTNGTNVGSGINYQWQTSPDGTTWSNTGISTPGYQTGVAGTAAIQYRLIATCVWLSISDTTTAYVITPVTSAIPTVTVTASPGTSVPTGTTVTFMATATNGGATPAYQWLKNGTPITGAVSYVYITNTLAAHDTIQCIAYSSMPCATPDSAISTYKIMSVGVDDVAGSSRFTLSPNPNNGTFHIAGEIAATGSVVLQVLNMVGQVVYTTAATIQNHSIDTQLAIPAACANGVYMLRVQTDNGNDVVRFSVQR